MLYEVITSGFGVIHWMSRPFDIYFKNLQNQVWSNSLNESGDETCSKMALDYFGTSQHKQMTDYLINWMSTAPQFGRETGYLGQTGVENHDERISLCDKRLSLLNKIDKIAFTTSALNRYKYFYGHEEWIKFVITSYSIHYTKLYDFYRASIYRAQNKNQEAKKYYAISAIANIRNAEKNNASLSELAKILFEEGKIEQANRYINFAMEDALFFNSPYRFVHLSTILPIINDAYQLESNRQKRNLKIFGSIATRNNFV